MRRAILAVLVLSLVVPTAGCQICCDLISEMLFPGSTSTLEEDAEMERQNANFARREDILTADREHPSHVWKPR
jgi:hypothetical protein